MTKSIIYYTDNEIQEPIRSLVRFNILKSKLPIVSVSLKPIDFGHNIVFEGKRGYTTYISQIRTALEVATEDYIFFCEHDVLYDPSHFYFTPRRDDIFYYNENVFRWQFGSKKVVAYDRMLPLSCLCVNRKFALEHYKLREQKIKEAGLDQFKSREPDLARKWGYEPGTKKKKRGGLTDDDFETWSSEYPNIDIRHKGTFSPPKVTLKSFKHQPVNWQEIPIDKIPGWNLRTLFNI